MTAALPVSLQMYDHRGVPITSPGDHDRLVDKVVSAYAHGGRPLERGDVDVYLLEVVDKAACSLLRDQWKDNFPVAAYSELLSTVAALRSCLGYLPTPSASDVIAWAHSVRDASHEAVMGRPADLHEVQIVEGPHLGAVVALWGPQTPQAPGTLVGPPLTLELPTEVGDSTDMEHGTAYYARLKRPHPNTGKWEYWLDRQHPFPVAGSRPRLLPADGGRR